MVGRTNPNARALRQNATESERLLWSRLRSRQLNGLKFRRQVTIGPYIADFACIDCRLIVEADGGQHSEAADAARTSWLEERGYRVERFWNHDILQNLDGVVEAILIASNKEATPSPQPSPAPREREF